MFPEPTSEQAATQALDRFVATLGDLLSVADAAGINLLIENNVCTPDMVGKLLLQQTDEFTELFERINQPRLGILCDTGHLNVSAHTLGFDRIDFVRDLQQHIRGFHLHDNDGTADQHQPVAEGSWIFEALSSIDHDVLGVNEAGFEHVDDLVAHCQWLEKRVNELYSY